MKPGKGPLVQFARREYYYSSDKFYHTGIDDFNMLTHCGKHVISLLRMLVNKTNIGVFGMVKVLRGTEGYKQRQRFILIPVLQNYLH